MHGVEFRIEFLIGLLAVVALLAQLGKIGDEATHRIERDLEESHLEA